MSLRADYLRDHPHYQWAYSEGSYGGFMLRWKAGWHKDRLPPGGQDSERLEVWLKDQTDGKLYKTRHRYVAYEHAPDPYGLHDAEWNQVPADSLMSYFYGCHHCPCHRKQDAELAGAVLDNMECEGTRFLVDKIVVDDLILYSETRTQEELEAELKASL